MTDERQEWAKDIPDNEPTTEEPQANALDVLVNQDTKRVAIEFERPTDAVEFDPDQAIMLGQSLIDAAEELGVTKTVILTSH